MSWKDLIFPVYLPSFLLAFGSGMLIPTLPFYAQSFDLSFSMVSLVIAASSIGTVMGDVPAGMVFERIGRKTGMVTGIGIVVFSMLGTGVAHSGIELIVYQGFAGIGMALWNISRHTYITDVTAVRTRGQALAIFGGINRIGSFASPAVGGALGAAYGLRVPIFMYAGLATLVLILMIWFIPEIRPESRDAPRHEPWRQIRELVIRHARVFASAGSAQIFAQMIRAGWRLIIPLYGASVIGLDAASVGLVITMGAALDMALFPVAGFIMDRFGRKYVTVPSFLIMSFGMAMIPFSSSFLGLLFAMLVIGFGNGLGSGCMMTLGADLAPPEAIGQFLGIWRFIGDVGSAGGPLVVGNVADLLGLSAAAFSLGGIGMLSSITMLVFVRETLIKSRSP